MKKGLLISYIAIGAFTAIAASTSLVWAAQEVTNLDGQEIKASLKLSEDHKQEYIEGQKFDPTGISFVYEDQEVDINDVQIEYDFSVSGTRVVKFSLTEGKKVYVAKLPVAVYHISHLDVRNNNIFKLEDDKWDYSTLLVYAEVAGKPKTFDIPNPAYPSVVALKGDDLTVEINETELSGKYSADIYAGKNKYTISCYDDAKFSSKRVLSLYNTAQTGETLTLYIDYNTANFEFPDANSDIYMGGTYVYTDSEHNRYSYPFTYHLSPGWNNEFSSVVTTSITSNGGLQAIINDKTFTAPQKEWHDVVLGNPDDLEKYSITFDANGGTGSMSNYEEWRGNFDLPQSTYIPPEGKAFANWSVNGDERKDSETIQVYSDTEIKPVWKDIPVVDNDRKLVLENTTGNGDALTLLVESTTAPDGFIYPDVVSETITVRGQYLYEKANGAKILYPFLYTLSTSGESTFSSNSINWRINDGLVGDTLVCTLNGGTYHAQTQAWHDAINGKVGELPKYTISFDANGGTGSMGDVNDIRGSYILPISGFTAPSDKVFTGWKVGENTYGAGDEVVILENTTIKAMWGVAPTVDAARTLVFVNTSSTSDTLTLFVETTTSQIPWISTFCDGNIELVTGKYLYTDSEGRGSLYPFTFSLNSWASNFGGDNSVIFDRLDGDGHLIVTINGINFKANADTWHEPVIGNDITADYLDNQINNGNERVAKLTPVEAQDTYGLYLYVLTTDYHDGFVWPDMQSPVHVTGKYVLINEQTREVVTTYKFQYRLGGPGGESWSSHFESASVNEGKFFSDAQVGSDLKATLEYASVTYNFTLGDTAWKIAILGEARA